MCVWLCVCVWSAWQKLGLRWQMFDQGSGWAGVRLGGVPVRS